MYADGRPSQSHELESVACVRYKRVGMSGGGELMRFREMAIAMAVAALFAPMSAYAVWPDKFSRSVIDSALAIKFEGQQPSVVVSVQGAFGAPSEVLSIYAYFDKSRDRSFAVRRAAYEKGSTEVSWAGWSECPQIKSLLVDLENVPPPRVDLYGIGQDSNAAPVFDGVGYSLWAAFPKWQGSLGYELSMSSNIGSPLAIWTEAFRAGLQPCWKPQAPAG